MSLVFNTPKSALNTTSKEIQNLATDCPPCPECPEVQLETADVEYTSNGEYTITPEGDGFSSVDVTVNVDVTTPYNEGYAAGETAGIATGKTQGAAEQKAKLTSLNVTENGSYNREDGYNAVTVNVPIRSIQKGITYGTYKVGIELIEPDEGFDAIQSVEVDVSPAPLGSMENPISDYYDLPEDYNYIYITTTITADDTVSYDERENVYVITKQINDNHWPEYIFKIRPYLSDGSTAYFPENFELVEGDEITLVFSKDGVDRITTITAEIIQLNLNGNADTWPFGTLEVTENGTVDPTGYKEIDVNVAGGGASCPDWSSIGWDCSDVNATTLADNVAYTAQKKAEFEAETITNFRSNKDLVFLPKIDLPEDSSSMFDSCSNALYTPLSFGGKPQNVSRMFYNVKLNRQPDFDWSEVTNANEIFHLASYGKTNNFNPVINAPNCISLYYFFGGSSGTSSGPTTATVNAPLCTNIQYGFSSQRYITSVNLTVSDSTNAANIFDGCSALTNITVTGKFTNLTSGFRGCTSLVNAPQLDYSSVTYITSGFELCSNMISFPNADFRAMTATGTENMFKNCSKLESIGTITCNELIGFQTAFTGCSALTTLGGFTNLGSTTTGSDWNTTINLNLSASSVLTKQSILNVFNSIGTCDNAQFTRTITLSAASYALLSAEDIAIATNKGWSVVSA